MGSGSTESSIQHTSSNDRRNDGRRTLRKLLVRSVVYCGLFWLSTGLYTLNLPVSRRLANLPYVLWVVAFNNAQLLSFALVEEVGNNLGQTATNDDSAAAAASGVGSTSRILSAFNDNGLVIFLLANLLTGVVNLTTNTLDTPPLAAMAILLAYAAALTAFALGLNKAGWRIKI